MRQAHLKASKGDAVAGAHLGLLGMCSSLRQLELVFEYGDTKLSLSFFLEDRDAAFAHRMAAEESLSSLKLALPINVRCTVHMFEECKKDHWCSYVASFEDPPCGSCDCCDRTWERAPWESNAACSFFDRGSYRSGINVPRLII